MQWLTHLNYAVDYIEENLAGEISIEQAARIACCSTHQFQRLFSHIAGIPLSEYIRHRRMSSAAFDLREPDTRVSDVAAKYGYQSPTAFTRAFQAIHGIPPSLVGSKSIFLTTYPRLRFQITVTGEEGMKYRVEKKGGFRVIGKTYSLSADLEENFQRVPKLWLETRESPDLPLMMKLADADFCGMLGFTVYHEGGSLSYTIGTASRQPAPPQLTVIDVPECTWVILQCKGPVRAACQEAYRRFYTEWLPVSGYRYQEDYDLEVYPPGDFTAPDYQFELWLSVIPAKETV